MHQSWPPGESDSLRMDRPRGCNATHATATAASARGYICVSVSIFYIGAHQRLDRGNLYDRFDGLVCMEVAQCNATMTQII